MQFCPHPPTAQAFLPIINPWKFYCRLVSVCRVFLISYQTHTPATSYNAAWTTPDCTQWATTIEMEWINYKKNTRVVLVNNPTDSSPLNQIFTSILPWLLSDDTKLMYFGNDPFCEVMRCFLSGRPNWSFAFHKTQTVSLRRFSLVTALCTESLLEPEFEGRRPELIYEKVENKTLARKTTNLGGRKFLSTLTETLEENLWALRVKLRPESGTNSRILKCELWCRFKRLSKEIHFHENPTDPSIRWGTWCRICHQICHQTTPSTNMY